MKKAIVLFFLMIGSILFSFGRNYSYHGPTIVGFWLYPYLCQEQADGLAEYDIVIIHNEIIFKQSPMIDYLFRKNPNLKLLVYFNPVEWFVPPYEDSPWAKKMVTELNEGEKKNWWLKQPNGQAISFWTAVDGRKTNVMDMRANAPKVDGKTYGEFIAERFNSDILKDKRISGVEIDNAWPNCFWLAKHGKNKGIDFDHDGKADKNAPEIDRDWKEGEANFIKIIRQLKGDDFLMISNPGNLDFTFHQDGKIYEDFPFRYLGDTLNDGWNINMFNASKTGPYSIINARSGKWFFALCSAMLLDNACFSDIQNAPYKKEYRISLGEPIEKQESNFKKNLPVYSRKYEGGTVYVNPRKKEAWITDSNGNMLYNTNGQLIKKY